VANAGGPPSGSFANMSDAQWEGTVQQNLFSTIRMFHEALPHVQKSDQGRLIAITSISAKQPLEGLVLSNATRAAVHGMIKTLSREIAKSGVTVNAVCPGTTRTDRIIELAEQQAAREGISVAEAVARRAATVPMGRIGEPMEFGAAVAFLCSQQAAFITGVALPVDGGFLAGLP
jgi:3-oxoacyl-[acyl-carrier protein] reductase